MGEWKTLTLEEYQKEQMRTAPFDKYGKITGDMDMDELLNAAMGMCGEAGETLDEVKKILFQGHTIEERKAKLIEEAGDVLWYVSLLADALNTTLDEIAKANNKKLRLRYPDGFDAERSVNRND